MNVNRNSTIKTAAVKNDSQHDPILTADKCRQLTLSARVSRPSLAHIM